MTKPKQSNIILWIFILVKHGMHLKRF